MKEKILIFSIGIDEYKNFDKSELLKKISSYNLKEKEYYTIITHNTPKYKVDFLNKYLNLIFLNDYTYCIKEDSRSYIDILEASDYMIKYDELYNRSLMKNKESILHNNLIIYSKIYKIFEEFKFSGVIVWGNALIPSLITTISKRLKIPNLILEEGYFREYGIQCSSVGSNIKSELKEEYFLNKAIKETENLLLDNTLLPKIVSRNNMDINLETLDYVFVPLQINTDTQIIQSSPFFKNMHDFIEEIVETIRRYNEAYNKTLKIIVKVHPEHQMQDRQDNYEFIHEKFKENVIFLENTDLNSLIYYSKAVITINSTVGLTSLRLLKKILVLGDAIYAIPNITTSISSKSEIYEKFIETLNFQVNEKEVISFLTFLKRSQLDINYNNPTNKSIEMLFKKLYLSKNNYVVDNKDNIFKTSDKYMHIKIISLENYNDNMKVYLNDLELYNKNLKEYFEKNNEFLIPNIPILKEKNNLIFKNVSGIKYIFSDKRILSEEQVEYNTKYNIQTKDDINFSMREGYSDTLIITFPAFTGYISNQIFEPITILNSINLQEYNILAFQDSNNISGSGMIYNDDGENIEKKVRNIIDDIIKKKNIDINKIIFLGSSKGGYSALKYSMAYPDSKYIVLSPLIDYYSFTKEKQFLNFLYHYNNYNNLIYEIISDEILHKEGFIHFSLMDAEEQINIFKNSISLTKIQGHNIPHNRVINKFYFKIKEYIEILISD